MDNTMMMMNPMSQMTQMDVATNSTDRNDTNQMGMGMMRSDFETAVEATFLCLIMVFSFVGNGFVIIAIPKTPVLWRDVSNRLIINLAVTDCINSIIVMPFSFVALVMDDWGFGTVWCDLQCAINYCFITVSMLTMTMISVDRYIAVTRPLRYNAIITMKCAYCMIAYIWLQGIIIGAIPVICSWVQYNPSEFTCGLDWSTFNQGPITYVICAFVTCFLIPGTVLLFAYIRVCCTVRSFKSSVPAQVQKKSEVRIMVSIVVVSVVFFICMTPFCILKVMKMAKYEPLTNPGISYVCALSYLSYYMASATNPLIYAILRKDFRRAILRLFPSTVHAIAIHPSEH